MASPMLADQCFDLEPKNLTYEIFSILEQNFLSGHTADPKLSPEIAVQDMRSGKHVTGRVRILSIDGGGATGGLLAAESLLRLESSLRRKSGNPAAAVSDYFDVAAGSGAGGVLAALLFTRRPSGAPICSAADALQFLVKNRRRFSKTSPPGVFGRIFRPAARFEKVLKKVFGESTLRDTAKSVLIPCYDLSTRAPFVFSRADAVEMDGYDFRMRDVCLATSAASAGPVNMRSVDGRTRIAGVDGGIAMNNPTAAAITHVLNNKQEYPFCNGVDDLMVVSLGNGESDSGTNFLKIAGDGTSDMVDQAVSMAFGQSRWINYVRVQGHGTMMSKKRDVSGTAEEMLGQKNVESVLFEGKKMVESTNMEKLEMFGDELIKEQERRKTCILPTVVLKQSSSSPRTSSATTLSSLSL